MVVDEGQRFFYKAGGAGEGGQSVDGTPGRITTVGGRYLLSLKKDLSLGEKSKADEYGEKRERGPKD